MASLQEDCEMHSLPSLGAAGADEDFMLFLATLSHDASTFDNEASLTNPSGHPLRTASTSCTKGMYLEGSGGSSDQV